MGTCDKKNRLYLQAQELVECMREQPAEVDAQLLQLTLHLVEAVFSRCAKRVVEAGYDVWVAGERNESASNIRIEPEPVEQQLSSLHKLNPREQELKDFNPYKSVIEFLSSALTVADVEDKSEKKAKEATDGDDADPTGASQDEKDAPSSDAPVDAAKSSPDCEIIATKRGRRARAKRQHESEKEDEVPVVQKQARKSSARKSPAPVVDVKPPQLTTRSGRKVKAKVLPGSVTPTPRKKTVKPASEEEGKLCIALDQPGQKENSDKDIKPLVLDEGEQFLCMYCCDAKRMLQVGADKLLQESKPSAVFGSRKELCDHLDSHISLRRKLAVMKCCLCEHDCQSAVKQKRSLPHRILAHISAKHQLKFVAADDVVLSEQPEAEDDSCDTNTVEDEIEIEKCETVSDNSLMDVEDAANDDGHDEVRLEESQVADIKQEMEYYCMFCDNVNDMLFSLDDMKSTPFGTRRAMRLHIEDEHTVRVGQTHIITCPVCQLEHRTTNHDLQQVVNRLLRHLSETHKLTYQRRGKMDTSLQTCECILCDIDEGSHSFQSRSMFRKHIENSHVRDHFGEKGIGKVIECHLCNAVFVTTTKETRQIANRYVRHIQASHNFPEFKSRLSTPLSSKKPIKQEPDDSRKARSEVKRCYPEGHYFCMYCNSAKTMVNALPPSGTPSFNTRSELAKHIVTDHTRKLEEGKTIISCPLCDHERTTTHGNIPQMVDRMIRHAREVHSVKLSDVDDQVSAPADNADSSGSGKKGKKGPAKAHYYCVFCNDILQMAIGSDMPGQEPYGTRSELIRHMQEHHVIASESGSFVICPLCQGERHTIAGNTSVIVERLLRHITDTHLLKYFVIEGEEGDEEGIEAEIAETEEEEKEYAAVALPWRCLICMENSPTISSMLELETHLKLVHINHFDSSGAMQCPQCDWKATVANGKPRVTVSYFINHCIYTHQLLLRDNVFPVEESAEVDKLVDSVGEPQETQVTTETEAEVDTTNDQEETVATSEDSSKVLEESVTQYANSAETVETTSQVYMETVECQEDAENVFNDQSDYTVASAAAQEVTCEPSTVQQLLASLTEDKPNGVDEMGGAVEETEITKTVQQLVSAIEKSEPLEDLTEHELTADPLDERLRYCVLCDKVKNLSTHQYQQHLISEHFRDKGNKVQLKCPMCPQKFSRSKEYGQDCVLADYLINHMVRKHGSAIPTFMSVMRCGDCGFETLLKEKLRAHMIREHNAEHLRSPRVSQLRSKSNSKQICDGCGMFLTKAGLKNHQQCCPGKIHPSSRTRDFKCESCSKSFFTKGTLNNHVLAVHMKIKRTLCASCGMAFFSRHDLEAHAWTRHKINLTGKPLAKCEVCEFQTIRKLMCHHNYRHAPKTYKCRHCDHISHSLVESRRHRQEHRAMPGEEGATIKQEIKAKTHTCPECQKVFQGATNLRSHLAHTHGVSRFECYLCKHITLSERGLKDHIEKNHPNGEVVNLNLCDICDRKFSSRCAFENHMYVKHKINISKREILACSICNFETLGHSLMRSHMRNHQTNMVRCSICSRSFPDQASMSQHIQTDHQPTVRCQYCQYVTRTKNHLERHIARQHTHQKFACNHCAYTTHLDHRYKNHLRTVHSIGKEKEMRVLSNLVQQEPEAVILNDRVVPSKVSLSALQPAQHQAQLQQQQQQHEQQQQEQQQQVVDQQMQQTPVKFLSQVVSADALQMDPKVLQHHIIQQPTQQEIIYHTQHLNLGQIQVHHDPQQQQQQHQQPGEVDQTSFHHTIQIISEAEAAATPHLQEQVVITTVTNEHEQQLLTGADLGDENLNVIYVTVPEATQ